MTITNQRELLKTTLENLETRNVSIESRLSDPSIIDSTIKGVIEGGVKFQEATTVQTAYNNLQVEVQENNTQISNIISILNSGIPNLPYGVKTTDIPCITYIKNIQNSTGNRSLSSEWGVQYSSTYPYNALSVMLGINKTITGVAIPSTQLSIYETPKFNSNINRNIVDLAGSKDLFYYNISDYAPHINAFFTLQNPTGTDVTISIPSRLNAYTTYTCAGANVFTPGITDAQINNGGTINFTITNVFNISSTSDTSTRNLPITIPAGKTVIVHVYSSFKYITTNTFSCALTLESMQSLISGTGIVSNLNVMYNMKSMIDNNNLNPLIKPSDVTKIEDLFTIKADFGVPIFSGSDLQTARNSASSTGKLNDGSQFIFLNTTTGVASPSIVARSFVNNSTAKASLGVGVIYFNSTTGRDEITIN